MKLFRANRSGGWSALSQAAISVAGALALMPSGEGGGPGPTRTADTSRVVVRSLYSAVFGNTRAIRIYLPRGYDQGGARYPVLYLNDGFAVFSARSWNAPATLDSLIADGAIPPMILVGIDNAASIEGAVTPAIDRTREYLPYPDSTEPEVPRPDGERYPGFVVDEVMPMVQGSFRVRTDPAGTAVGGASYGGIAALTTALRRPGVFGALLLESTPLFLFDGRLVDEADRLSGWPDRLWIGVGSQETDDEAVNRRGRVVLERFLAVARSHVPADRVRCLSVEGATHNPAAWRHRLPFALRHLYSR